MNEINLNIKNVLEQTQNVQSAPQQKKDDLQKIKKACKDFEAIFTYYLLKTMRQTIPKGSNLSSLSGKDTYNMMMDQKVAEQLSSQGNGLGLQKMLFEQLTKNYPKEAVTEKNK